MGFNFVLYVFFLAQSVSDECSVAGVVTTCIVEEAQKVSDLKTKSRGQTNVKITRLKKSQ